MEERELETTVRRNEWRLLALDKWRDETDRRIAVLESKVNDLRFSDAVAEALAAKLDAKRKFELTALQKLGAGGFALALVVAPLLLTKLIG